MARGALGRAVASDFRHEDVGSECRHPSLPETRSFTVLYAFLCYNDEPATCAWSKDQEAAVMASLGTVTDRHPNGRRLGPLGPPPPRTPPAPPPHLRRPAGPRLVIDGPFAEPREQLLGFFVIGCNSLEHALETAKELGRANPGGSYEIRPILQFWPGAADA